MSRGVILLRPEGRDDSALAVLRDAGFDAESAAITRTELLGDDDPAGAAGRRALAEALAGRVSYDWFLVTSAEAVRCVQQLGALDALPGSTRIGAIGPMTARALLDAGRRADVTAGEHHAEGLIEAIEEAGGWKGKRVLLVRAEVGRPWFPEEIVRRGGSVTLAPIYRTVIISDAADRLARIVREGEGVHLLLATSAVPLEALADRLEAADRSRVSVAAIGPVTADQARRFGFTVVTTASAATVDDLAAAAIDWLRASD